MPAGVSWGQYIRFTTAAMLSMFAGSQMVHIFYRPLDDFDKYVKEAMEKEEAALKKINQTRTKNGEVVSSSNDTELDN